MQNVRLDDYKSCDWCILNLPATQLKTINVSVAKAAHDVVSQLGFHNLNCFLKKMQYVQLD